LKEGNDGNVSVIRQQERELASRNKTLTPKFVCKHGLSKAASSDRAGLVIVLIEGAEMRNAEAGGGVFQLPYQLACAFAVEREVAVARRNDAPGRVVGHSAVLNQLFVQRSQGVHIVVDALELSAPAGEARFRHRKDGRARCTPRRSTLADE